MKSTHAITITAGQLRDLQKAAAQGLGIDLSRAFPMREVPPIEGESGNLRPPDLYEEADVRKLLDHRSTNPFNAQPGDVLNFLHEGVAYPVRMTQLGIMEKKNGKLWVYANFVLFEERTAES